MKIGTFVSTTLTWGGGGSEVWRDKSRGDVWRVREICEKRVEVCGECGGVCGKSVECACREIV